MSDFIQAENLYIRRSAIVRVERLNNCFMVYSSDGSGNRVELDVEELTDMLDGTNTKNAGKKETK